ncbi:universal stress protein [Halopelagius fulvigenes]|uniref:Universal stress protein n=1 Tax=Halopelagius fulvigenes TaxID=1198324 RepID=A0ABD5TXR4_9EURY
MDRGVVLLEDTEMHRRLLREAKEHAVGADTDLVLLVTLTEEEYEETHEMLDTIGSVEHTTYTDDQVLTAATNVAEELARDVLADGAVSYEIVPRVADEKDRAETVVTVAEETGSDHAFVLGRRRSPTGKAIFGDLAQHVVLNFDGYVTLHAQ